VGKSRTTLHMLLRFWPIGRFLNWIGRKPPFSFIFHDLFSEKNNQAMIIPVNQVIHGTESVALPEKVLKPLVEMASDRYILNECLCRKAEQCQEYPHELGCLFLGRGARKIHPSMGQPVSTEEAIAHINRAVSIGLVPMIIHAAFDAYVLGIPYNQMLAVCFCCDCCCTVRSGLRMGPEAFWDAFERLPNLGVEVSEDCAGCGMCVPVCAVQAITLVDNQAVIGDRCKGCGRCVTACPLEAIHLKIGDVGNVPLVVANRVQSQTDIGQAY
jgi:ferredoxin